MKSYLPAVLAAVLCVAAVAPAAAEVPAAPNHLRRSRINADQIRLRWRDQSDNEAGFEILRRAQTVTEFESRGVVGENVTEFIDEAPKGTVYIYRVVAFNEDGDSGKSNDCFLNRNPPPKPSYFNVRLIALTIVRVSWSDRANGESGFEIQRAEPGKKFKTIARVGPNVETYDDWTLDPANSYIYRMRTLAKPAICWTNSRYTVERAVTTKGGVRLLQVDVTGRGKGTVTSIPPGISCGNRDDHCTAEFPLATDVTLIAKPTIKSVFRGWVGALSCDRLKDPCTLNMGKSRVIGAPFRLK